MMLFFWIFLIVIAAIFIMGYANVNNTFTSFLGSGKKDPVNILKHRFAKGEISEEEYEERKAVLEEDELLNFKP